LPEITPAQEGLRVHHHQLHLVIAMAFRPNAAQHGLSGTIPSKPLTALQLE